MSHGRVRPFTWVHHHKKNRAWGFTVSIGGKRVRRQGYLSRAEAQDALGGLARSLAMVMRYAHLAPQHLRAAVSRLDDVMVPVLSGENRAEQAELDTLKGSR